MSQREPYQLMPPLSDEEFQALKYDIKLRGVLVPLEYDETGAILDGHHRWRAIQELLAEGIKVNYTSIIRASLSSEEEKRAHVRAINIQRRHLNTAQKRELITAQLLDTPTSANTLIANSLGVTDKTVAAVRREMESRSEIPTVTERMRSDGKTCPSKPNSQSVVAKNPGETKRVLAALSDMPTETLPNHQIDVNSLERHRREADSAARAKSIGSQPAIIGDADIRHGNFRDVLRFIPDGSVDLICTDPPYGGASLPLWGEVADFAARVLRPGGLFVAYSGQQYLPAVYAALTPHLDYVWQMAQIGQARKTHNYNRRAYSGWKPILVFAKPPFARDKWFDDVIFGEGPEKDQHDWQQREDEACILIEDFSRKCDLVIDPMLGSGTMAAASVTLGRRFVGCDIDAAAVSVARERVRAILER